MEETWNMKKQIANNRKNKNKFMGRGKERNLVESIQSNKTTTNQYKLHIKIKIR